MKDKDITQSVSEFDDVKPELDADWFAEADAYQGTKLVKRGRPKSEYSKLPVTIRLDRDLVDWFKRGGEGWQTRINSELRKVAGL